MAKTVKLTPALLRSMIKEEKARLANSLNEESTDGSLEKEKAEEVEADEYADTVEDKIDYIKALKIKEAKANKALKAVKAKKGDKKDKKEAQKKDKKGKKQMKEARCLTESELVSYISSLREQIERAKKAL